MRYLRFGDAVGDDHFRNLHYPCGELFLGVLVPDSARELDAEHGKSDWNKVGKVEDGRKMTCGTCHGDDLSKVGKHYKTGKTIEPMAPSVNPERFTDVKKIEKWFRRNCNDAWGRECTAQEKGDVLKFLLSK